MSDSVHHPEHYNNHPAGIECIDVVEHMNFNLGNAIKYLWRAGLKHGVPNEVDLKKAIWYIERELGMHCDSLHSQCMTTKMTQPCVTQGRHCGDPTCTKFHGLPG